MSNRIRNAKRNLIIGIIQKIIYIVMPFIVRTILLVHMGEEYTGLGGLFNSILQVLNVAELGFASAISYGLYKPIAERDSETICTLLAFFRKVYKIVGVLVLCVGICISPFLRLLIRGTYPQDINLYVLFFIQLLYTVAGYLFFAYKEVLISANQRQDIISMTDSVVSVLQGGVQIALIVIYRNYYLFALTALVCTLLRTLFIGVISKKQYPDYIARGNISLEKRQEIINQVKGIAVGRMNVVSRNAFDDIFISIFMGLSFVTIYDNYYYIMNGVIALLSVFTISITAGVGDSVATESVKKNRTDFFGLEFYFWFVSTICAICLVSLYQLFMNIWVGESLIASDSIMILFVMYFYIAQMGKVRSVYSNATGIWWKLRKISIAEMITNVFLNYFLGKTFGMTGILLATIITVLLFSILGVTIVLFREYFGESPKAILFDFLIQGLIAVVVIGGAFFIRTSSGNGFISAIASIVISTIGLSIIVLLIPQYRKYVFNLKILFGQAFRRKKEHG